MDENGTTRKKNIFLQQIVMPHMSVLLFKRVSEHVDNSEVFDTLYTEFPKSLIRPVAKDLFSTNCRSIRRNFYAWINMDEKIEKKR